MQVRVQGEAILAPGLGSPPFLLPPMVAYGTVRAPRTHSREFSRIFARSFSLLASRHDLALEV